MKEMLDKLLQRYRTEGYYPGVVCKVVREGSCIYESAMGYAEVEPEPRAIGSGTLFDIASLTKIITATMILRLVTKGALSLEDPVLLRIPEAREYRALRLRLGPVTLKDLLTHHSGLIDWYPLYSEKGEFLEVMEKIAGSTAKVEGVRYSDLNFMLLGRIVENATGKSLDEALQHLVVEPLGIGNMFFCPEGLCNIASTEYGNRIEKRMCKERNIRFDAWRDEDKPICGEVNDGNAFYFFKGISGHAGIFSDIDSLIKISQLYIRGGERGWERYIDKKLVREAIKEQKPGRGLGWQISPIFPEGCGHSGFTGTSVWLHPASSTAVVTLTNRLHVHSPRGLEMFRRELHESILKNLL